MNNVIRHVIKKPLNMLFIFMNIFSQFCFSTEPITVPLNKGPDFLILGGVKCGTTSLFHYLKEHPNIRVGKQKELNFFNKHFEKSTYTKGIEWYLAQFPQKNLDSDFFLTGEGTPGYLAGSEIQEISSLFPKIKLIILLRNPIDRALSSYKMRIRQNEEQDTRLIEELFTEKLINFRSTTVSEWDPYIYEGVYVSLIRSWRKFYPDNQLLIICSEELFANPNKVVNDVFAFLELPTFDLKKYKIFNKEPNNEITLPSDLRERMLEFYAPYNQELQILLRNEMHIDIDLAFFGWDVNAEPETENIHILEDLK